MTRGGRRTAAIAALVVGLAIAAPSQATARPGDGLPLRAGPQTEEATPAQWERFLADLADLEASLAVAEAALERDRVNDWRWHECRFQSLQRGIWTDREERLTAQCAVERWSVPGGLPKLMSVISCESGWNRWAYNPGGPYVGLAQHALSAYVSRINTYNPPAWDKPLSTRWSNSRGQLVLTARMAHAGGWRPWSCA